jgi:ABC-2 type transport system permease protein
MTALDIASKDFADAVRSRALWFAIGVYVLLMILAQVVVVTIHENPDPSIMSTFLASPGTIEILPMIGLIVGYRAIVGERETGNIKFLLGLPHSRWDIILGKFFGRYAVVAVTVAIGFAASFAIMMATVGVPSLGPFVAYMIFVLLFSAAVVATAVGVSATVSSSTRAMTVLIGGFLFMRLLWDNVPNGIYYVINGTLPAGDPPLWHELVDHLNPLTVLSTGGDVFLPAVQRIAIEVNEEGITATQGGEVARTAGDTLVYEPLFLVVLLLLWIALPLSIGYLRFRDSDLN